MIDKTHDLPVVRQVQLLDLSRSSAYYLPQPTPDSDLRLMRRMDTLHLEHPFAGARMLRDLLKLEGVEIGRKHVSTLMKKMGIEALYSIVKPTPAAAIRRTASTPTYCATSPLTARIKSGPWTRRISRCNAVSSI